MTHDQHEHDHTTEPMDQELASLSVHLDRLGAAERRAMPEGLHERVLPMADCVSTESLGSRFGGFWNSPARLVALAAVVALMAIPAWMLTQSPGPSHTTPTLSLAVYTTEAIDLFDLSTSVLSGDDSAGVDALLLDAQEFDARLDFEVSTWLDDPEAI